MKRALVFVDHTDAGCAALEAASRVAGARLTQVTVVSIGHDASAANPALAAAGARHVRRATAQAGGDEDAGGNDSLMPSVESISLEGEPPTAVRGLLEGARPDLAIVGSRRAGVDGRVLAACLGSPADAVLVAQPGRRREDWAYRHVAIAGTASEVAIQTAKLIAGEDALLSLVGLVPADAPPGRLAQVRRDTIERAHMHEAEPAIVEGGSAELASWVRARGVEVVVVERSASTGDRPLSRLASELIERGPGDVVVVRPSPVGPRRARRRRSVQNAKPDGPPARVGRQMASARSA